VLGKHAKGHWTLILDADELFVYPGFEENRLPDLLNWLDIQGSEAVVAPMLDMYPYGPLMQLEYRAGDSLIEACPYFDGSDYEFLHIDDGCKVISRGGARHRLFWNEYERNYPSPYLVKYPLVKWRNGLKLEASTHKLSSAKVSDVSCLLMHFKFLQDFVSVAETEVRRQEHFMGARQYSAYAQVLSSAPDFYANFDGSIHYESSKQLIELGLMQVPENYPFLAVSGLDDEKRDKK
jgi:hypothetical protein